MRTCAVCTKRSPDMKQRTYKRHKRGSGRHVQLSEYIQASEAWASLKPGPRALYIELKRRFNGSNNGEIFLSHRDAANALNAHRNTVCGWFDELQARGFIRLRTPPHLGPSGIGRASKWALEEMPTMDGKPAGKAFMRWKSKQDPRTKNGPSRHNVGAARIETGETKAANVLNFVPFGAKTKKAASQ